MSPAIGGTAPSFGTFFLPGPTEVRPAILAAMQRPMMPHRGRAFEALFAIIEAGLRDIFLTARPVYVCTSSASGLMEGAVRNAPVGPILALVNGAFSDRFGKIAAACARETKVLEVPWGATFDLDEVERRLGERRFAAVTVAHSETSTGVLSDIRAITAAAHRNGTMCLVDSVTGVAGAEFCFDEWDLDFALTGSQKALALPPGLALGVASTEFLEHAKQVEDRGLYFDVVEFERYALENQTPSTPALPLLYALEAQLGDIGREGIERRWARHAAMRDYTGDWVERCAKRFGAVGELRVLAPDGARSPTVTAVALPAGIAGSGVAKAVGERGFTIGAGYGKLRDTTIRIGHMGDHTVDGLARCLSTVEQVLEQELAVRRDIR